MENIIYYDFDGFRLDVINGQLLKNNQSIPLTHKAFKTLLILVQNHGQLVKKEDIINEIWHDSFVEDSNLTQHIYILRKTLGNNSQGKPFIETIPKRGYFFTGEIQKVFKPESVTESISSLEMQCYDEVLNEQFIYIKDADEPIHKSEAKHKSDTPQESPFLSPVTTRKKIFANPILLIILLVGIIGITFSLYRIFQPFSGNEIKSIAVLPFKPIGKESSDEKLGFGLADAVITSLSKQQRIPVRSISTVFQFTDKNFNSLEVGKELGVDSVLEGTIQREGELIRVSVRLIKVSDGSTIWAENFDEKFTYIFAVQDSISTKVTKSLMLNLSNTQEQQLTARNTSNTEAYLAYQSGRYFWNKRTKDDLEKAVGYFQKAIELDGNYAIAYAMLADCYNMLIYYNFIDPAKRKEMLDKADDAAKKALSLDDLIPEPHIAMSYIQIVKYKNTEASVKQIERALQISPYNPTARIRYGWQILQKRDLDLALEQMRIAQENDPLSPISNSAFCTTLAMKRNYIEALKYCEKAVEIMPNLSVLKIQLGNIYYLNGKSDQAISIIQPEINSEPNKYEAITQLAYIYAKTGKTKEAEEIYLKLKKETDISDRSSNMTLIAFSLGKKEEALQYFKTMLSKNFSIPGSMIFDPYWEEIFKDQEFQHLISQYEKKS